ncbi:hypothetical protein M407DRAFT_26919 [Tulasnella calospora MUT 4182]|uniref:Uncharacterized protein n=1 Tax=Tulasnella calospora MUT 4182 TaxID=1051891 RepID=A0A0C3KQH0_9AGAM|nr:hypothetical protein M407DRAFT_26919 [Tulasnella calospora MUT 4182]
MSDTSNTLQIHSRYFANLMAMDLHESWCDSDSDSGSDGSSDSAHSSEFDNPLYAERGEIADAAKFGRKLAVVINGMAQLARDKDDPENVLGLYPKQFAFLVRADPDRQTYRIFHPSSNGVLKLRLALTAPMPVVAQRAISLFYRWRAGHMASKDAGIIVHSTEQGLQTELKTVQDALEARMEELLVLLRAQEND